MIEKELELVTWDNITLNSGYVSKVVGTTKVDITTAFGEVTTTTIYGRYKVGDICLYTIPKLTKDVKILGETITIDIIHKLGIGKMLFKTVEKEHPLIAKELKKRVSKNYFDEINKNTIANAKAYKEKVQKQYNELFQLFTEYGTKSDIATMKDINDLYYCEAEGFMLKLEERINKKANPKNLKLYKALMGIRGKDIITCKEG